MISLIFIGIGIMGLIAVILFKKQINRYYENVKGLSEDHAKFYKNIVVFLIPIIFIIIGTFQFLLNYIDDSLKQEIINKIEINSIDLNIGGGILAILFGLITFLLRLSKNKYKYFAKLSVFEEKYGEKIGYLIHTFSYTIAPIIFGIYLLFKYLN